MMDRLDVGMHQAFGCGVFGLVLPTSSRFIFSTSCLILALPLLDFFLKGMHAGSGRERAGGFDRFVLWALGIGISFN